METQHVFGRTFGLTPVLGAAPEGNVEKENFASVGGSYDQVTTQPPRPMRQPRRQSMTRRYKRVKIKVQ